MKIKNILVATDFSNESYNALFYVTQIFASKKCTFHILHIYDDLTATSGTRNVLFVGEKELSNYVLHHKKIFLKQLIKLFLTPTTNDTSLVQY
jgi:hypothetical protein